MALKNFKIVSKFDGNWVNFWVVLPNGDMRQVCRCEMPNDGQMVDTMEAVNSISDIIRKRIRKSV